MRNAALPSFLPSTQKPPATALKTSTKHATALVEGTPLPEKQYQSDYLITIEKQKQASKYAAQAASVRVRTKQVRGERAAVTAAATEQCSTTISTTVLSPIPAVWHAPFCHRWCGSNNQTHRQTLHLMLSFCSVSSTVLTTTVLSPRRPWWPRPISPVRDAADDNGRPWLADHCSTERANGTSCQDGFDNPRGYSSSNRTTTSTCLPYCSTLYCTVFYQTKSPTLNSLEFPRTSSSQLKLVQAVSSAGKNTYTHDVEGLTSIPRDDGSWLRRYGTVPYPSSACRQKSPNSLTTPGIASSRRLRRYLNIRCTV
ncbi:hypothetical protein F5884DRAFT_98097 [Xylogone sp. PMI_703]|nr:hypothetical protein F5884DRAFT_98097 [Xylogone sp. PMI_703]